MGRRALLAILCTMRTTDNTKSRTRDVAFTGLFIALIVVSAWITVPIGPVPVTMQMLAIPLAICVLRPTVAISAVYGYELLGALGVPVFSGMRGGIGVLLGPTGGFLLGYLLAVPIACALLHLARRAGLARGASPKDPLAEVQSWAVRAKSSIRDTGIYVVAGVVFTLIAYAFGVVWFMHMSNVGADVALATCVIPFIIPDLVKIGCAACLANALAPLAYAPSVRARA